MSPMIEKITKANAITRDTTPAAILPSDIKDAPAKTINPVRAANTAIVTATSAILTPLGHLRQDEESVMTSTPTVNDQA